MPNLDLLVAGPASPNPAELLGSNRMRELLAEARKEYDWVIVDTPPVLFVSDSCIVSALCDGVILVVRAGVSNRSVLQRSGEQLGKIHAKIIGAVLNGLSLSRLGRHYSSYYHHGYARYSKDYHRSYYGDAAEDKTAPAPAPKPDEAPKAG